MLANSTYASGTNDTASTLVNNTSLTDASQMNGVASACVQIETVLGSGTTLIGSKADLATRLGVQVGTDGIINPVGAIQMYGGSAAPTGWLLCDGTAVSRTTYATLFTVLSTTYGAGDGSTTFNVPDMRGRVAAGVGTGTGGGTSGTGAPTGGAALTAVARGTWKGTENAVNISHTHTLTDPGHAHQQRADQNVPMTVGGAAGAGITSSVVGDNVTPLTTVSSATGMTISTNGVSGTGLNIQPIMGLNFIVRY